MIGLRPDLDKRRSRTFRGHHDAELVIPATSTERNSMADHPAPVLITGASRGIGEATARLFAQKGHPVALLARSVAAIESLAHEIGGLAIPCDVADEVAVGQAVYKSATQFGGIGIVINNAGTLEPAARIKSTRGRAAFGLSQSFLGLWVLTGGIPNCSTMDLHAKAA